MEDIPVDESNKKYTIPLIPIDEKSPEVFEAPIVKEPKAESTPKYSSKPGDKGKTVIAKFIILRSWIVRKVEEFKKVQYPYLYSKFYDLYHFELVGYKPLDIALKVLMLITVFIVFAIFLIVIKEVVNLAI